MHVYLWCKDSSGWDSETGCFAERLLTLVATCRPCRRVGVGSLNGSRHAGSAGAEVGGEVPAPRPPASGWA
jgi:hypothetical protein